MADQADRSVSRHADPGLHPSPDEPPLERSTDSESVAPPEHALPETSELRPVRVNAQLAAHAMQAADQAVQLARLAEASANLAHQLSAQAFHEAGQPPSPPDQRSRDRDSASDSRRSDKAVPALVTTASSVSVVPSRPGGHIGRRFRDRQQRLELASAIDPAPRQVHIAADSQNVERDATSIREFARQWKSMFLSTGVHVAVLVLLGFLTFAVRSDQPINTVLASIAEEEPVDEEEPPLEKPIEEPDQQPEEPEPAPEEPLDEQPAETAPESLEPVEPKTQAPLTPGPEPAEKPTVDLAEVGSRSAAGKALLLERYGGTAASEAAVQRALEWFASRQRPDGSWNFSDVGPCTHAGNVDNPMGATAYVLLCYLGAGHTDQGGPFENNVRAGLTFLVDHGRRVPAGGDFRGPNCREHDNFYVQAPVAMALSEAFQMTRSRRTVRALREPAQLAVDFLCHAQDPQGGGWRYEPQEPGCTSVTVLVAMALKSAVNAGLKVPPRVWEGIAHYLDSVRSDQAPTGRYGYRVAEPNYRISTTSMALLCGMYLGWGQDSEELRRGIALLDKRGPYDNLYYGYYATQVLRHWGGEEWRRWNSVMRDDLVRTQITQDGPELGSWTPRDRSGHSLAGGRLFTTCLATMTLEVYYRYLPLYGLPAIENAVTERPANDAPESQ